MSECVPTYTLAREKENVAADKATVRVANHPSHTVNNRPICGVAAAAAAVWGEAWWKRRVMLRAGRMKG